MIILGIDTSAKTASVGLVEDNNIIEDLFINEGLTHSETLVPMIDEILNKNNYSINDIDAFAVNNGPGSFTGIRIGVAVVKGLVLKSNKPCYEVSTLDSIAYNCKDKTGIVVATMDARRNQVYNAIYKAEDNRITKIVSDRSILIEDLYNEIKEYDCNVYIVGDGQINVQNYYKDNNLNKESFIYPDYIENLQKGSNTALIAFDNLEESKTGESILPSYLKLSQAEQELRKKKGE